LNLVVKHPAFFAAVLLGLAAVEGCSPRPTPETAAPAVSAIPRAADGRPDLNGVWQALSSANWNLEAHAATAVPSLWRLGALGAVPAGQSVVVGGTIPYRPEALAQRDANRAGWPAADPETKCFMPGIPRANYQPWPFEIVQGEGDILFVYEFGSANRTVYMNEAEHLTYDEVPVDQWMGWSNGRWDGDTLVIDVFALDPRTWLDRAGNYHSNAMRVTERFTPIDANHVRYEATIEDPNVFTQPWTISMPLYRRLEDNATVLEYKCVEFAEPMLYGEQYKTPPQ
jgi:hypothetical protein